MAVEMTSEREIRLTRAEAVQRITEDHLESVLHPQFAEGGGHPVLTRGLGASPGAAVGRAYFSADDAAAAASRGEAVVLVRSETSPEDVHGMLAAQGILTARGGLVSHAAVVARGWGKPAVVGAEALRLGDRSVSVGDVIVAEGDWLSIDGTQGTVMLGQVPLTAAEPSEEFLTILAWADDIRRSHLKVRANADTGPDAANARRLGAEGIGLCRTEHMFLAEDRLPIVRRMILADTPEDEKAALEELRVAQRADFVEILEAMDGLPVTIRLLDPPLHEFLPSTHELAIKEATVGLDAEERRLYEAAKSWQEANPMLGTRGVRLGVIKPGLYGMQVAALMEAATDRVLAGGRPIIEIMIPLTVSGPELALARSWVEEAVAAEFDAPDRPNARAVEVSIGTMIETPRAALRAGDLAEFAEFFSFGTNDLTQMTFGFSRDDVEGRMMSAYLEKGLLARNPFEVVDAEGVGELVRMGVERGRAVRPDLKIGVCGEHGGDPASIATFYEAGLDYVSCSPFRVPVARLAAAQAVLEGAPVAAGSSARKASAKKAIKKTAKRAPARKASAKKAIKKTAKKAVKKAAQRAPAKRAPAKKTAKKAPARKIAKKTAKRAPAKKTVKKAPARKIAKKTAKRAVPSRAAAKRGRRR
jgi:pyruvate,orthophosphate dikinase